MSPIGGVVHGAVAFAAVVLGAALWPGPLAAVAWFAAGAVTARAMSSDLAVRRHHIEARRLRAAAGVWARAQHAAYPDDTRLVDGNLQIVNVVFRAPTVLIVAGDALVTSCDLQVPDALTIHKAPR